MSKHLLEMRKVTACYGVLPILHGIDLDIKQGEIVALIGGNGAGKTTLMMTIFGRPRAREGRILFQGRDITCMPTHDVARLGIVQSPEGRRIFSRMTVLENLQMGAIVANDPAGFARDLRARLHAVPVAQGSRRISVAARCRAASSRCWRSPAR